MTTFKWQDEILQDILVGICLRKRCEGMAVYFVLRLLVDHPVQILWFIIVYHCLQLFIIVYSLKEKICTHDNLFYFATACWRIIWCRHLFVKAEVKLLDLFGHCGLWTEFHYFIFFIFSEENSV